MKKEKIINALDYFLYNGYAKSRKIKYEETPLFNAAYQLSLLILNIYASILFLYGLLFQGYFPIHRIIPYKSEYGILIPIVQCIVILISSCCIFKWRFKKFMRFDKEEIQRPFYQRHIYTIAIIGSIMLTTIILIITVIRNNYYQ